MTLQDELIARIENEEVYFSMIDFFVDPKTGDRAYPDVTNLCGTAACMGGHLHALRPEGFNACRGYATQAREIWLREMGTPCRLDFFGFNFKKNASDNMLSKITRADAIAHIKGIHPDWPLLDEDEVDLFR